MYRSCVPLAAVVLIALACARRTPSRTPDTVAVPAVAQATVTVPAVAESPRAVDPCPTPAAGLRLGSDTIAGLPMRADFRTLRTLCEATRLDTVSPGGYEALALRFPFTGGDVWAVSGADPYTQGLSEDAVPEFWYAAGDSVRFADGTLVPLTLGGLLKADSDAVLRADGGDDTEGSYVIPCRYPRVALIVGYRRELPDTGAFPLRRRLLSDTVRYERIVADTDATRRDPALRTLCINPR